MILALSCLLFQFPVMGRPLPFVVSEPVATATMRPVHASTLDLLPDAPLSRASSSRETVASTDSGSSSAGLYHATAAVPSTQNSQSFSTIRLPEPQPTKPARVISAERLPSRRTWLLLSVAQHGAATFDAYSTRRAIASGAVEADPLMRPFAGSPGIYAAIHICPLALDYMAARMQRSQHQFLRRTWWVPQAASTSLFITSGAHNLHVAH